MEFDSLIARVKWALLSGALLLFLMSGCFSWGELIYRVSGRTIEAGIVEAKQVTHRGRFGDEKPPVLLIHYAFVEPDGTRRNGVDEISPDRFEIPADRKVMVQYTAGPEGSSRLAANASMSGPFVFLIALVLVGFFGYRLFRDASAATSRLDATRK
jgi:hypothetical protein